MPAGTTAEDVKERFAEIGAKVEVEIVDEGDPDRLDAVVSMDVERSIAQAMAERTQNEIDWNGRRITIYVPTLFE